MKTLDRICSIASVLCILLLASCSKGLQAPDLGALYSKSAKYHGIERHPVIVMPGILGSRLIEPDSRRVVWGAFGGDYADPSEGDGARLISLPMREGAKLSELRDEVVADGALDRFEISIFGLPVELSAYAQILASLGVGGFRDQQLAEVGAVDYGNDHFTCFQFDYDWRHSIVESAKVLHEFILEKRAFVQQKIEERDGIKDHDVKFNLVAHSMGGLVLRYYLRFGANDLPEDGSIPAVTWEGARYVNSVVLVGTPNAGSVQSLYRLRNGARFAPIFPPYDAAILGTMPSVYELLPRPRHKSIVDQTSGKPIDIYDPAVWERLQWGLMSPDEEDVLALLLPDVTKERRKEIARDHLRKVLVRAKQLHQALDQPAKRPASLPMRIVVGDSVPTNSRVTVSAETGETKVVQQAPGDDVVLRSSALLDERLAGEWAPTLQSPIAWTNVTFIFSDHLGITADPNFTDNLLYYLLEQPR